MYVCIVQNFYNYKTKHFLKFFLTIQTHFSVLFNFQKFFTYLFSWGRKLLWKISRNLVTWPVWCILKILLLKLVFEITFNCILQTGNVEDMDKFNRRLVKVTKQHSEEAKQLLKLMGVPYIDVNIIFCKFALTVFLCIAKKNINPFQYFYYKRINNKYY